MINYFGITRKIARWGSGVSVILAAGLIGRFYRESLSSKIALAILASILCINMVLYLARLIAIRKYQQMLLVLYEDFNPDLFLRQAAPLLDQKAGWRDRINHAVHVANAYLMQARPEAAAELLTAQVVPNRDLELKGLVLSNLGTAYLQKAEQRQAEAVLAELRRLTADPKCKPAVQKKLRQVIAYQQLCLDSLAGKAASRAALEQDFAKSPPSFHRICAGIFLARLDQKAQMKQT